MTIDHSRTGSSCCSSAHICWDERRDREGVVVWAVSTTSASFGRSSVITADFSAWTTWPLKANEMSECDFGYAWETPVGEKVRQSEQIAERDRGKTRVVRSSAGGYHI